MTTDLSAGRALPAGVAQSQNKDVLLDLGGGEMDESLKGLDVVKKLADQDSKKFAELLRNWLR